jgi:SAM-dependent MidA family methyltransferase
MVATWLAVFMQTPSVQVLDPLTNAVNRKFRLVELGGGRGLLMQDILRSFRSYSIVNNFDLCFIEGN